LVVDYINLENDYIIRYSLKYAIKGF